MNLRLKRTPGIYVVGFMGAGKSTVGRHLAHRLGWSFFDTDAEIEAAEKTAIADIFAARGEDIGDGGLFGGLNLGIGIEETPAQAMGQMAPHGALAGSHEADHVDSG